MKKKRLILITIALAILGIVIYSLWSPFSNKAVEKSVDKKWTVVRDGKIDDITLFGSENAYVIFRGDGDVSQNYVVSKKYKSIVTDSDKYETYQTELKYFYLVLYDLRKEGFPAREINLNELVDKYKKGATHDGSSISVFYEGKDYYYMVIRDKFGNKEPVFLDLDTSEFVAAPAGFDPKKYNEEMDFLLPGNIQKQLEQNNIISLTWSMLFASASQPNIKLNKDTNFVHDYPDIAKRFMNGQHIYLRKGQVTPESYLQDLRHLLAPVGQDKLEVYAVDNDTGEKTYFESYSDYLEWKQTHSEKRINLE